ncbi:MAG: hypothetical protein QXS14_01795 [Desulfurococcaceae archaeon]
MSNDQVLTYVAIALVFLMVIAYYAYEAIRTRRRRRPEYMIRELLVCVNCNYRVEKDHEAGDFIGLIKDTCPKCGGDLKIRGIYAVEKKQIFKP